MLKKLSVASVFLLLLPVAFALNLAVEGYIDLDGNGIVDFPDMTICDAMLNEIIKGNVVRVSDCYGYSTLDNTKACNDLDRDRDGVIEYNELVVAKSALTNTLIGNCRGVCIDDDGDMYYKNAVNATVYDPNDNDFCVTAKGTSISCYVWNYWYVVAFVLLVLYLCFRKK